MLNPVTLTTVVIAFFMPLVAVCADAPWYHWKTEKDGLRLLTGEQVVYCVDVETVPGIVD